MMKFVTKKIGEVADIRRGASPRPIDDWMSDSGIPWVKISDATKNDSRFIYETEGFIKKEGASKSVEVFPEDLIVSNSATPGLPKIMKIHACIHDGWLLVYNFKGVTRDYLFYQIKFMRKYLINQGNGSIFTNLKTDILKDFPIRIPVDDNGKPDLKQQDKIVKSLINIEEKIENNNKLSAELENVASSIFDSWFLQFDFLENDLPYKTNGGLMKYDKIVKGEIPADWHITNIKDICSIIWGQCPEGDNILPIDTDIKNALPYCSGAGDMRNGMVVDCQAKTNASRREANSGDILMSVAGSIGALVICDQHISLGRAAVAFRPRENELAFCYFIIKKFINRMKSVSTGSIQKVINDSHLDDINFAYEKNAVGKFAFANNILKRCMQLSKENDELTKLRNDLLPLLMSGQVLVR